MTFAYEGATGPGWGTLVVGQRRVPFHLVAIVLGTGIWLGAMLLKTGGHGVVALWTNLLFLAGLVFLGSLTQSLSLRRVSTMFFAGGLMMGLMVVVSAVFVAVEPDRSAVSRALILPPLEEVLKLAPVLFFAWRRRRGRLWAMGATDLLLLGAASGAGFGLVEDAYIRARFGWPDQLAWLPVSEILGDRLIAGHAVWTALAGATLGLGLLLRSRGRLALWVAASGFVLVTLDHISNNLDAFTSGVAVDALNLLLANGFLVAYLFVAGVAAVVAADLYVLHRTPPRFPRCQPPPRAPGLSGMLNAWAFRLNQRALTYATFQYRRARGRGRRQAGRVAALLARSLQLRHALQDRSPIGPPTAGTGQSSGPARDRAQPASGSSMLEAALEPSSLVVLRRLAVNGPVLWLALLALSAGIAALQLLGGLAGLLGDELLRDVGSNVDPDAAPTSTGAGPGATWQDWEDWLQGLGRTPRQKELLQRRIELKRQAERQMDEQLRQEFPEYERLRGGCLVTTACVTRLGKPDDCDELEAFRRMRDFIGSDPSGQRMIDDYYRTAPLVIEVLARLPGQDAVWQAIYQDIVAVTALMDDGRPDHAARVAAAAYDSIKARCGIE